MDAIKALVLRLIEEDRVRMTRHFRDACKGDDTTIFDAFRAIRNGTCVEDQGSFSSRERRYRFHGSDYQGRKVAVVVAVGEGQDLLWLITFFTR